MEKPWKKAPHSHPCFHLRIILSPFGCFLAAPCALYIYHQAHIPHSVCILHTKRAIFNKCFAATAAATSAAPFLRPPPPSALLERRHRRYILVRGILADGARCKHVRKEREHVKVRARWLMVARLCQLPANYGGAPTLTQNTTPTRWRKQHRFCPLISSKATEIFLVHIFFM